MLERGEGQSEAMPFADLCKLPVYHILQISWVQNFDEFADIFFATLDLLISLLFTPLFNNVFQLSNGLLK